MLLVFIFRLLAFYVMCGFLFAVVFVFKGAGRIDESARGSSFGFKLIIIPGAILFWPLLVRRWITAAKQGQHD